MSNMKNTNNKEQETGWGKLLKGDAPGMCRLNSETITMFREAQHVP